MGIFLAIIIFSLIVIIHELGHFILAKLNGITVTEFSLGLGPRLLSGEKGGTRYSLKLLPFGGSCAMLGEDDGDSSEGAFGSKSVWARIAVVVAGPIFNFVLAFVLSLFIIGAIGIDKPVLLQVNEGYPAYEAGLREGDEIVRINNWNIRLSREITNYVNFHQGETMDITYVRDGESRTITVSPVESEGRQIIGIVTSNNNRVATTPIQTLGYSAYEVKYWIQTTLESLKMLVRGQVGINDMSGPVGIVDVIDETYQESSQDGNFYVWLNMLNIAILLTANLGVMNLLPLPALDGGRLVFLVIEAVRRKRLDPEKEGMVHFAGLMLLMLLMVVVMFNDVRKIFM